jgi:hypothetical protein
VDHAQETGYPTQETGGAPRTHDHVVALSLEQGGQIPNLCNALLLSHFLQMPVEFLFKDLRDDLVRRRRASQGSRDAP